MNNYIKKDVEKLYNAFIQLCDFVETSDIGCENCPMHSTCFSDRGMDFADALKRIREFMRYEVY